MDSWIKLTMKVVGIDIGLVNLAFAVYNTVDKSIRVYKVSLIQKYKYSEKAIPFLVQDFIEDNRELFQSCALVVIEMQMKRSMLLISHSICSFLLSMGVKSRFVSPRSVRIYFNISKNNYKLNKKASIELIPKLLSQTQLRQADLKRYTKKDDCAEAIILAFYAVKNPGLFVTDDDVRAVRKTKNTSTGRSKSSVKSSSSSSSSSSNKNNKTKMSRKRKRS